MGILRLLLLLAVAVAVTHPAAAQDRDNLTGIGPVHVRVENVLPNAERAGLTTTMLQTATESRLRGNGVPLSDESPSFLYLNVNTYRAQETGPYSFEITLEFRTPVQVVSTGRFVFNATIWQIGAVGSVGAGDMGQIQDGALDFVDRFSNDYLAVNAP